MIEQLYDDFKSCDDEVCALFTRIDKMIDTVKASGISDEADDALIKLRSAKRTCEKTMMSLIQAKERMS